ncbi:hypothetical protein [Thalassobacillus devorans]|uniref:hypothetical protein n=1 Tax=Thalassobacillus devorans TaxID=279813 RepID=UPI0007808748|nr:hypothetical protein [Thalassobacillus devorans]
MKCNENPENNPKQKHIKGSWEEKGAQQLENGQWQHRFFNDVEPPSTPGWQAVAVKSAHYNSPL